MTVRIGARRGFGSASWLVVVLGCALAACAPRVEGPAPVVGGPAPVERGPQTITVQRGQSLSEIAHSYHVPMRVIAEANGLSPPYRIQVGRTLVIPGAGPPRLAPAPASLAALPPAGRPESPQPATQPALPPAAAPDSPSVSAEPIAPPAALHEAEPAPQAAAPAVSAAPLRIVPENPDSGRAAAPPATGTGAFLWPVRGHVLATYGSKSDGTHNDGINIAAPRGTAVQAVDAGVVAYAGNELRGYGNLVLIKHANGWISAYAHCDAILVKRGEKVERGQVIARVGSTGNVSEPQLHFELRRGQHAVDPREFMPPLPTATTRDSWSS
ncbi:MAG: M23 family metallopeptidase [Alphaproteobacteria bacterium]|nr:M23 family metallopeptidase [Alphaproteobacteria bacterium]